MARSISRVLQVAFGLLLVIVPFSASGQVGRMFVSADAYAGVSRVVHVGKIVELQPIDYEKPLTFPQTLGKPHRLVFEIAETNRGEKVKRLELVLALQTTVYLAYMRDHSVEIMLVGGPTRLNRFPGPEIGIEEQGERADGEWYEFRVQDPVGVPESGPDVPIASQINTSYDSCRMFTIEFEIVLGSEAILKRVRGFAKKHPKTLSSVTLGVPNEIGALCGNPNAFCGIILPICSETKATLVALKDDPELILRRIVSRDEIYDRSLLLTEVDKALVAFPKKGSRRTNAKADRTRRAATLNRNCVARTLRAE